MTDARVDRSYPRVENRGGVNVLDFGPGQGCRPAEEYEAAWFRELQRMSETYAEATDRIEELERSLELSDKALAAQVGKCAEYVERIDAAERELSACKKDAGRYRAWRSMALDEGWMPNAVMDVAQGDLPTSAAFDAAIDADYADWKRRGG